MAAAASTEFPMPLTSPDLPPVKGKKKGRPAMVGAGWSSLPYDLLRQIAGSFLATNDVDCYVGLRAVCHHWRSAIDDPKTDASDSRFHPRRWIILDDDEVFKSDTRRLLVNTTTGRFLHKELPLLRNYYVVATTPCGFFVLADRSPPHAAHLLNPLTGAMAPVPSEGEVAAAVWFGLPLPPPAGSSTSELTEALGSIGGLMKVHHIQPPSKFISGDPLVSGHANDGRRCFFMEFAGQLLIIVKLERLIRVLRLEATSDKLVCLRDISNYAIFIGHQRCLAVCADKFPSVEANCVYYTKHQRSSARICKDSLKDDKTEMISEADDFVKQGRQFALVAHRPFTIIQLLSSYAINVRDSELASQQAT
ncbi:hypothetical protein D1007_23666 [Hordeum vulgare]|nr:hypothetical protein D1007_23666 [Hordeum vulgare]